MNSVEQMALSLSLTQGSQILFVSGLSLETRTDLLSTKYFILLINRAILNSAHAKLAERIHIFLLRKLRILHA